MTEKEARGAGSAGGERRPDKLKTRELLPESDRRCLVDEVAVQFGIIDRHRWFMVFGETRPSMAVFASATRTDQLPPSSARRSNAGSTPRAPRQPEP
jgi:hypothetical protein